MYLSNIDHFPALQNVKTNHFAVEALHRTFSLLQELAEADILNPAKTETQTHFCCILKLIFDYNFTSSYFTVLTKVVCQQDFIQDNQ